MNPAVLLRSGSYGALKRYVLERTGLSYYVDRDEDLAARISRRLAARAILDAGTYLQLLAQDPGEVDLLVGELTIGETYFFRQPAHFDLLRSTILPEILERKRSTRRIRIWSAGCATGAEPYSLAILLRLEFEKEIAGWDVSIFATDINPEFLAAAQEGLFGSWALRETPAEIQARCFRPEGKRWRLLPEFASGVDFRYHNLVSDAHPASDGWPFDLIVCRNVLIYFSRETIQTVTGRIFDYLETGGWLLVGHAEPNAQNFARFETVAAPEATAYRKSTGDAFSFQGAFTTPNPADVRVEWTPPVLPIRHAVRELRDVPALSPAPLRLPVDDVRLLADRGNWDGARQAANQLIHSEPMNAAARFTLGLILEHAGEPEAAREALRKAIYLDRSFALAHYHLGTLLQASGDSESATRSFSTVLRLVKAKSPTEPLAHGDGITARELGDLAQMHLELAAK